MHAHSSTTSTHARGLIIASIVSIVSLGDLIAYFSPQNGWTALHLAAQEGKVDVVRLLTEAQAQINIQTEVHTLCHV